MTAATIISMLASSRQTIEDINQTCIAKGLPPAFKFGDSMTQIEGNRDYRFEGFGLIFGLPPKLGFWVHYKPGTPEHVAIGRFVASVGIGNLFGRLFGRSTKSVAMNNQVEKL